MKKLLLILLCLPMLGFGQDDCGDKPKYNGNRFQNDYKNSSKYKNYLKKLEIWKSCKNDNPSLIDIIDFKSEDSVKEYLDNKKLESIEGIYYFDDSFDLFDGNAKIAIVKEGSKYIGVYIQSGRKSQLGKIRIIIEEPNEKGFFDLTQITNSGFKRYFKGHIKNHQLVFRDVSFKDDAFEEIMYLDYPNKGQNRYSPNKRQVRKKRTSNSYWSSNGSGVIISEFGHIITNQHVINDFDEIEVEFILNDEVQKFNAEIVQVDKTNDLAIIKIVDVNFDGVANPPYNFKTRSSDVGTKVYAFGYPMALSIMGKEIKVTDGIISSKTGFDGNITTYQITAPIQGGNSGGPLFDDKGNLIGINSSGIRKDIADNVGYSIKTNYVLNLIDILPKSIDLPSSSKLANLPLTQQIKEISKYVVLVKVK